MTPSSAEFDQGRAELLAERQANDEMVALFSEESSVPNYHEAVSAIRKKREAEKGKVVQHEQDPSFDYRWCNPRSENFPYLVVKGWAPIMEQGRLICDNELILCRKDKTVLAGEAEKVDFLMVTKGED